MCTNKPNIGLLGGSEENLRQPAMKWAEGLVVRSIEAVPNKGLSIEAVLRSIDLARWASTFCLYLPTLVYRLSVDLHSDDKSANADCESLQCIWGLSWDPFDQWIWRNLWLIWPYLPWNSTTIDSDLFSSRLKGATCKFTELTLRNVSLVDHVLW